FFIRGDLLYWKPHISDLELDFGRTMISNTIVDGVQKYRMKEFDVDPRFKWNTGYRVAAGYQSRCNGLELALFWTHFQDHGTRRDVEDPSIVNRGKIDLKFDQVDLILAYSGSSCSSFKVKSFIGVRGAEIHEKVN